MNAHSSIFSSPDIFPEKIDLPGRKLHCCHMTAGSYEQSPFLDHRIIRSDTGTKIYDIGKLLSLMPDITPPVTHYVYHNAFCCSTLFSRCLNAARHTMILREPNVLMEVASFYRFRGTSLLPDLDPQVINDLFRLVSTLMSRRYPHYNDVIIKPSDACNNLMARLLNLNPHNKCILMYSDLERFLVAILKLPQRKEWIKLRANELFTDEINNREKLPVFSRSLDSPQVAAYVWVLHMKKMRGLIKEIGSGRVCSLNSEHFMSSQTETIAASLRFLGIETNRNDINNHISDIIQSHSKADSQEYGYRQREHDFRNLREELANDVEYGIEWARKSFGNPAVSDLDNPLPGF